MWNIKGYAWTALFIGHLCTVSLTVASSPSETAVSRLGWTAHELDARVAYNRAGIVEIREEGASCFTIPHSPAKPRSQAIMTYDEELRSLVPERLLYQGMDGRRQIITTESWPNCIHGQMDMYFEGVKYGGSGVLVGPHHFLTAGHCVFDREERSWAASIRVHLGLNGAAAPFNEVLATRVYTCDEWLRGGNTEHDIALVVLNRSIGYETGWAGLLSLADAELLGKSVHVTGYPGDKGFKEMWAMDRPLRNVYPERFSYEIDTFGGQSGGAVWINQYDTPYVVGVHTHGGETSNSGVRISRTKLRTVKHLIEESGRIKTPGEAEPTEAETLFRLGEMYDRGDGVAMDKGEAFRLYSLAANQRYAAAQCNLGKMYYYEGNYVEAFRYYKLAADQGHAESIDLIGKIGLYDFEDIEEAFRQEKYPQGK